MDFYKKIKVLEELNSIFPIQIKQLFSNIQIDNHIGCYGLYFITALLHKDLKCKAPLIDPNLRRNLGKWAT
ncbi:hypothetical protein FSC12_02240 [Acinetobacter schindleri]|nr:hypothetical protein FSC12_02240 [Acinetobacter schindleri]